MTKSTTVETDGSATQTRAPRGAIDRSRLALFFGALVALVIGFSAGTRMFEIDILALTPIYMFTPAIAAVVVLAFRGISPSEVGLRVGNPRWLVVAAIAAPVVLAATALLAAGLSGVALDPTPGLAAEIGLPETLLGGAVAVGVLLGIGLTINAVFAFGEEFGWRGYLLWELAPMGFWKASLAIGAVWGLWHAPVIVAGHNYPSFPLVGIVAMTAICIAMSPLYTYLVIRAESVMAAVFLHGVFNAFGQTFGLFVFTDDALVMELVASPAGIAGIVVFGLIALGIAARGAPSLDRGFIGGGRTVADPGRSSGTEVGS